MIPSWATVGAKVVCVDAAWSSDPPFASPLRKGAIYTIESAYIWHAAIGAEPVIRLVEVDNPIISGFGYLVDRFRPLVIRSHEQDMEIFRKIASNLPTAKELEPVVDHALERLNQ